MAAKLVELENIGPVELSKRRGNRNIRLSFSRNGNVRVSLPYWLPYQAGLQFVLQRQDWILAHRPKQMELLGDGDRIGKAHRLRFTFDHSTMKPTVRLSGNNINVILPLNVTMASAAAQQAAGRGAIRALKKEAGQLLPQRLALLATKHNFSYQSVSIKRLSSRWGSCSNKQDISLNLFLMQLPWHLIDYVLVHELVHTEYLNHSPDFWQRFASVVPHPKSLRKELKHYPTTVKSTSE